MPEPGLLRLKRNWELARMHSQLTVEPAFDYPALKKRFSESRRLVDDWDKFIFCGDPDLDDLAISSAEIEGELRLLDDYFATHVVPPDWPPEELAQPFRISSGWGLRKMLEDALRSLEREVSVVMRRYRLNMLAECNLPPILATLGIVAVIWRLAK